MANADSNERVNPLKKVVNYENLLDPSNESQFTTIPAEVWGWLQEKAAGLLKKQEDYIAAKDKADRDVAMGKQNVNMPENVGVPSHLVEHWRSIRKGIVPFGLKVLPASGNA